MNVQGDSRGAGQGAERQPRWVTRCGIDAVSVIIGVNALVFVYMISLPPGPTLLDFIQRWAISVSGIQSGAWWQSITHLFLHGGDLGNVTRALHLIVNMLVVYVVGKELLFDVGNKHFLFIYFFSGVLGGFFQILVTPESPLLGASGAAFGVVTAHASMHAYEQLEGWVFGFRVRVNGGAFCHSVIISSALLGGIALVSAGGIPLLSNMGHFAHLGGALGGLVYVRLLGFCPRPLTKLDLKQQRVLNDARLEAQRTGRQV